MKKYIPLFEIINYKFPTKKADNISIKLTSKSKFEFFFLSFVKKLNNLLHRKFKLVKSNDIYNIIDSENPKWKVNSLNIGYLHDILHEIMNTKSNKKFNSFANQSYVIYSADEIIEEWIILFMQNQENELNNIFHSISEKLKVIYKIEKLDSNYNIPYDKFKPIVINYFKRNIKTHKNLIPLFLECMKEYEIVKEENPFYIDFLDKLLNSKIKTSVIIQNEKQKEIQKIITKLYDYIFKLIPIVKTK